jgi:hypothetical protein
MVQPLHAFATWSWASHVNWIMKLSTALKISGFCLLALAAEATMAYLIFSNYAYTLTETGQYTATEAYYSGPIGTVAKVFYGIFGVTIAVAVGAPLISLLSRLFQK